MTATAVPVLNHFDTEALQGLMERRADSVLLDVRSPGEFASVHIEGSHNLPLDLLHKHLGETLDRIQGPVAVICAQGVRSEEAGRALSDAGAPDVRVLEGGIQAWEARGGPVVRGKGRWAMDRQVRFVAGSLTLSSVLASALIPRAKWIAAAVGMGMFYSAVSNSCAMAAALGRLPYNSSGPEFDLRGALDALGSNS
jgi:rhodanese-related sulfurtransferase